MASIWDNQRTGEAPLADGSVEIGMANGPDDVALDFPADMADQLYRATQDMMPFIWQWALCDRYIAGDQYLSVLNTGPLGYSPMMSARRRSNIVFNFLPSFFRAKAAQMETILPDVAFAPVTPEQGSISQAIATEEAWRYQWNAKRLDNKLEKVADTARLYGTGVLWTYVDPDKGDFCIEVKTPFDFRVESGAVNDEQASWFAIREIVKKKDLERLYPGKSEEMFTISSQSQLDRIRNVSSLMAVPKDSVETFHVYFKDGRYGIYSNQVWLWKGETPNGVMPVQIHRYQKLDDRYWGMGLIYPLIDPQNAFNRVMNRMLDTFDQMSNPIWLVPLGSNVQKQSLTNVTGQIVTYNAAGGKPTREGGVMIGQDQFELAKMIYSQAQDIAEIHQQSLGRRAVGVNSGRAIQELTENDASMLTITQKDLEQCCRDLSNVVLTYMRDVWTEGQTIRTFDSYGKVIYKELTKMDLQDHPNIHVEAGSLFKSDLPKRERQLLTWMQAGAITPQEAFKRSNLRNFATDRMTTMLRSYRAQSILEAARHELQIEIYPTDPIEEIKKAFEDFMWSPDYYAEQAQALMMPDGPEKMAALDKSAQKMNYIRNIYVSLITPPDQGLQQVEQLAQKKLYPRAEMQVMPTEPMPPGNPNPQTGPMPQEQIDARAATLAELPDHRPNLAGGSGGLA